MNPRNRTFFIVGAVIVLMLVVAGIAVLATGSDDADSSEPSAAAPSDAPDSSGEETRPVEVTGEPLPGFEKLDPDPAFGFASPVVSGEQFDGSAITIGGPTEGPTLLVFLAHWCPHCNAEVPELIELEEAGEIPADLAVTGISTAVASDRPNYPPSEWIVDKGWPWPTMADDAESNAFIAFGGTGFPYLVLLDADGALLGRQSGESSSEEINAWIDATLATAPGA